MYLAAILIPSFGALFGLRLAYFRGAIITLQRNTDIFTEDTYKKFQEIIYSRRKKDRDPEIALNLAAQFLSWKNIQEQLVKFYQNNKYYEYIDLAGIVSSIIIIITKEIYDIFLTETILVLEGTVSIIAIVLMIISAMTFLKSYLKLNRVEERLGVGKVQSTH